MLGFLVFGYSILFCLSAYAPAWLQARRERRWAARLEAWGREAVRRGWGPSRN